MNNDAVRLLESINERLLVLILLLANRDDSYDDGIQNAFKGVDATYDYVKLFIRSERSKLIMRGFGHE